MTIKQAFYEVEIVERDLNARHPYAVKVNGTMLTNKQGKERRFKDTMTAAVAGSKYVDAVLR